MRGHSFAVIPISWRNRRRARAKLKLQEMGSRYFFIVLYVFLEHHLSRGDYVRPELRRSDPGLGRAADVDPGVGGHRELPGTCERSVDGPARQLSPGGEVAEVEDRGAGREPTARRCPGSSRGPPTPGSTSGARPRPGHSSSSSGRGTVVAAAQVGSRKT